ncbi:MAG: DUF2511 domain-containing protein [Candidatus Sedimenticola sp. (ex Thyasira tokunagai)]
MDEDNSKPPKSALAEVAEGGLNAGAHALLWLISLPWLVAGATVLLNSDWTLLSVCGGGLLVLAGAILLPPVIKSRHRDFAARGKTPPSMGWFVLAYFGLAFAGVMLLLLPSDDEPLAAVATPQVTVQPLFAEEYGDQWPFTILRAGITCLPRSEVVLLADNDVIYALNGTARKNSLYTDLAAIWKDNPEYPGSKMDVSSIIDIGLSLCN